MLRTLVLLLALANVLTWAYTQGFLGFLNLAPTSQREPERLAQQVEPERLRLLPRAGAAPNTRPDAAPTPPPQGNGPVGEPAAAAVTPVTPTGPATACWQVSGYNAAQTIVLNAALQGLRDLAGRWTLSEGLLPARWIVYLGPLPNAEVLQRRRAELRQAGVDHRDVQIPNLGPGLALGTFSNEEGARQALRQIARAGVNGARVVQERPDSRVFTLRLPAITDAERARVDSLGAPLAGRSLERCP